jgi:hypothetical protein
MCLNFALWVGKQQQKKQMLKFANYFLKGRSLAIYKMLCDLKTLIGTKWQISRIVKSGFYETC